MEIYDLDRRYDLVFDEFFRPLYIKKTCENPDFMPSLGPDTMLNLSKFFLCLIE